MRRSSPEHDDTARRLGKVVQGEARRRLAERQLRPDPELIAKGWQQRFTADLQRTEEAVELYRDLGFEVHTEPVQFSEEWEDCQDCMLLMQMGFKVIYTRKKSS